MYCSHECKIIHLERLHQFECAEKFKPSLTEVEVLITRTKRALCELLYRFEWDVDAVKTFFDSHRNQHSVFDFDMSDPKEYYKNLLFVSTNPKFFSACGYYHPSTVDQVVEAVNIFVLKNEKLRTAFVTPRAKSFFKFLVQLLLNVTYSITSIDFTTNIDMTVKDFSKEDDVIPLETAIVTFYVNNVGECCDPGIPTVAGCDHSIFTKNYKGKNIWIIARPVKVGEKLLKNILPEHLEEEIQPRAQKRRKSASKNPVPEQSKSRGSQESVTKEYFRNHVKHYEGFGFNMLQTHA
jgi:hypothetical protein